MGTMNPALSQEAVYEDLHPPHQYSNIPRRENVKEKEKLKNEQVRKI